MSSGHQPGPDSVAHGFQRHFGRRPTLIARAPGRINLLGAHVDTQEGWVLPAAIDRVVWLAAGPSPTREHRWLALDLESETRLDPAHLPPPVPSRPDSRPSWQDLPRGVLHRLLRRCREVPPLCVAFTSNVPMGAGVSSSAAVAMAFLLAFEAAAGFRLPNTERATVGREAENLYLGVGSGAMDQCASLMGREGHLVLLDCRDLSHEHIPLPPGLGFLVADSGIRRRLAESGFNDRQAESRQALETLRRHLPDLVALRDLSSEALAEHGAALAPTLERRARHVVEECARVRRGADALRRGELTSFAGIVQESHESSRVNWEVSLPELDLLAQTAWTHPACHGARLMGGGFGGCVGALVESGAEDELAETLARAYERRFGRELPTFSCRAAEGAGLVDTEI